jgi:hypothetical protein
MAAATWTDPVDRADGYVVGETVYNQLLGNEGNLQFLYENAMIPVAVNNTAQSTTSTSATDLLTLTPTNSIGINDWAILVFEYRKQALAANAASFGLKVNSTTVRECALSWPHIAVTSATNRAEDGWCRVFIPPRSTANYGSGITTEYFTRITSTGAFAAGTSSWSDTGGASWTQTNALPNAAITSVTIRAQNHTASNAVEVKNAALYMIRSQ